MVQTIANYVKLKNIYNLAIFTNQAKFAVFLLLLLVWLGELKRIETRKATVLAKAENRQKDCIRIAMFADGT